MQAGSRGPAAVVQTLLSAGHTVLLSGITFICSVPGHEAAGMKGAITVEGSTAGGDSHGGPGPATDVKADPNAPKYTLYPAEAPKARLVCAAF